MKTQIIESTKNFVWNQLGGESSGHDYEHSMRVYRTAMVLCEDEKANDFVVAIAALVHDTIDTKVVTDENDAIQTLIYFLEGEGVNQGDIEHIIEIITTISFRKGASLSSIEAAIVQDADRLDAMGAIGIARAFTYGGAHNRLIYAPGDDQSTVQHFYDKLLHLYDLLNTNKAKEIGKERHTLMQDYLLALLDEINPD